MFQGKHNHHALFDARMISASYIKTKLLTKEYLAKKLIIEEREKKKTGAIVLEKYDDR